MLRSACFWAGGTIIAAGLAWLLVPTPQADAAETVHTRDIDTIRLRSKQNPHHVDLAEPALPPVSRSALHWAVRHAGGIGATVHAVAVWHRPIQFAADSAPLPDPEFEAEARKWLTDALPELSPDEAEVPVRTFVDEGDPTQRLLEHARQADLLVLGNRGRGPMAAALVGSVALRCAHHARCPVVLVPEPDQSGSR